MDAEDIKNTDKNFKLETKVGGQMEESMQAKAVIIKNHRKPHGYEKETFEKRVNDMKANGSYTVPRLHGPSSQKLGTAGFIGKMTFGSNKDKMIAIEEGTDIKARQSIKPNEAQTSIKSKNVRPSIKRNKVCARVDVRAYTRNNERVHTRNDVRADLSDWDPGGGPVKPRDPGLVAWWG